MSPLIASQKRYLGKLVTKVNKIVFVLLKCEFETEQSELKPL